MGNFTRLGWTIASLVTAALLAGTAAAPAQSVAPASTPSSGYAAGSVSLPRAIIPYSTLASPEARETFARIGETPAPDFGGDIKAARAYYGRYNDERLAEMRSHFATRTQASNIGGVRVDIVDPVAGVSEKNQDRVLINLHGGAFMWGAGSGALVEAVPIAATANIRVVTVDYRMAPEARFPAASEDVAKVYRGLLQRYKPENIGIYGCSAGGILTAQAVAWFDAHRLPRPGAVVMLCAAGAELSGDSAYLAPPLNGQPPIAAGKDPLLLKSLPYMAAAGASDPLAFPIASSDLLRRFPPSLLITGSRDFSASSMSLMHRRLVAAGVKSDFFLFDGLWHAFFIYPALPESQEVYRLIRDFFDVQLGKGSNASAAITTNRPLGGKDAHDH